MRAARKLSKRLRGDQRGFTLIELLITMPLALLLLFALLNVLDASARNQRATSSRAQAVTQAKVGLDRMAREIREASSFELLTSQVAEIVTPVRPATGPSSFSGNLRLVRYDCTGSQCTRYEGPKTGPVPSTGTSIFTDVLNDDVFTPTPSFINPTFIGIKVLVRVKGQQTPINLTDGVDLRNTQFGG
jgi:prepilin-type N-terminal cleavage/methylation domain-containing protein